MKDETKSISTFNKNFTKEISDITLYDIETGKEFLNTNYHSKCPINYDYDNCSSKEYGHTCVTCYHYESTFKLSDLNFPREVEIKMTDSVFDIKGLINAFYGFKIIENKSLTITELTRVKIHKRKRIDKKWLKRYGWKSIKIPDRRIWITENKTIIIHPSMLGYLSNALINGNVKGLDVING